MKCIICNEEMKKSLDWHFQCPACHFEKSTLEPGAGRGVSGLETLRRQNFETLIKRISHHMDIKGKSCLEVGCAEGWFTESMQKEGANISAIEPSNLARDMIAKGYHIIHGFFPDAILDDKKYDLIVFNDVFEHLPNPAEAIKKCEDLLNNKGMLVINIPNSQGFFYRLSKILHKTGIKSPFYRMWQVGLPSPHITYFSPNTLAKLGQKYTKLKSIDNFSLPSIETKGLKERIQTSYSGIIGGLIYGGIICLTPLIKILPQDITVTVFKK